MNRIILALILVVPAILCNHDAVRAIKLNEFCQTKLFSDRVLTTQVEQLSIYEKVFLEVRCDVLLKGSYVINTQWMDEKGKLHAERGHEFLLGFPRPYSAVFKFKQMPVGSLKKVSSGDDFEAHQYGKWSVLSFINGEEIDRTYFTIIE